MFFLPLYILPSRIRQVEQRNAALKAERENVLARERDQEWANRSKRKDHLP